MEDLTNNGLSKLIKEITDKREALIQERIKKICPEFDPVAESKKRFPRITREMHQSDNSERWYWNDGTDEGLLIITFFQQEPQFDGSSIKTGYSYK